MECSVIMYNIQNKIQILDKHGHNVLTQTWHFLIRFNVYWLKNMLKEYSITSTWTVKDV